MKCDNYTYTQKIILCTMQKGITIKEKINVAEKFNILKKTSKHCHI